MSKLTSLLFAPITSVLRSAGFLAMPKDIPLPSDTKKAVFGLGCFWAPDGQYPGLHGVLRTTVGYAGGQMVNPTYRKIGDHTEVIEVEYDPTLTDYKSLLDHFWQFHDSTIKIPKRQYISLILYNDDTEKRLAEDGKTAHNAATEIQHLDKFYAAEGYHQKYHLQHATDVLDAFELRANDMIGSCISAKLSAFVVGYGTQTELEWIDKQYGLENRQRKLLEHLIELGGKGHSCGF